jgi:hypothetical protein
MLQILFVGISVLIGKITEIEKENRPSQKLDIWPVLSVKEAGP